VPPPLRQDTDFAVLDQLLLDTVLRLDGGAGARR
jgi:hypothetical protein